MGPIPILKRQHWRSVWIGPNCFWKEYIKCFFQDHHIILQNPTKHKYFAIVGAPFSIPKGNY